MLHFVKLSNNIKTHTAMVRMSDDNTYIQAATAQGRHNAVYNRGDVNLDGLFRAHFQDERKNTHVPST